MANTNFLIGRGELLTHDIPSPKRRMDKSEVYTLTEAKKRLTPQIQTTNDIFKKLPAHSCPHDYAVAKLTMNPSYIARSYFPTAMLRNTDLKSVGSKTVKLYLKNGKENRCY